MRISTRHLSRAGLCVGLLLVTSSCNLFGFMDQPGDNEEYLSKARACFDQGDIACAQEYYKLLKGGRYDNIRESELAYTVLYQYGIDMRAFMAAFGGGGGGAGLTSLANSILKKRQISATSRQALYDAYRGHTRISGDPELAGLVRFLTAMTFAAHVLAENAGADRVFVAADIAANPTGCINDGAACTVSGDCGGGMPGGGGDLASGNITGVPGIDLFNSAMEEVDAGLDAIGTGGGFDDTKGFAGTLLNVVGGDGCYRQAMLNEGVGF